MDMKTIEKIASEPGKQWYITQKEVAAIIGCCRQHAAAFLIKHSVPYYFVGRSKLYFLPEVMEAIEQTRWQGK